MQYAVGIDLGGTFVKAGLVAEDGGISHATQMATDANAGGPAVARQIAAIARRIFDASGTRVVGIGLGSPGLINAETGVVDFSPNFEGWTHVPLAQYVRAELGDLAHLPVFLENDVNAMALGELTYGAGRGTRNMVAMTLGTGVGGGVVVDGNVYHGATNTAGEIGHMTVVPDGRRCGCGNDGCLEALVGTAGLLARTREAIASGRSSALAPYRDDLTPRRIADAANDGDELARGIFAETGRYIGIVLASLANLLNPEMAVIGGGIAAAGEDLLFRHIRGEVRRRAMDIPANAMRVVPAALGNDAGIVGSAAVALRAAGAVLP
jgi:glucokinase